MYVVPFIMELRSNRFQRYQKNYYNLIVFLNVTLRRIDREDMYNLVKLERVKMKMEERNEIKYRPFYIKIVNVQVVGCCGKALEFQCKF